MLSVILIWFYMLFTCYVTGFACVSMLSGRERSSGRKETDYLYAGIAVMTVYSQFFSIFWKVGFGANLILLIICFLCIAVFKREMAENFRVVRLTITPVKAVAAALLFLLFAYGTSTGLLHYDTGLYHAQSIRWIEEYGIVPGLGNLHSRLAYNSAAFCLSALYSMAFLGGQSYHVCAGFLGFLLALVCGEAVNRRRGRKPLLSDFARLIGIYYLLNIFDEMVSPASDYFMVLLVLYIVIRWLDLTERKEKSTLPFAMLCVLSVVVLTVKLSGALILLFTLKPALMMIKEKRRKEIAVSLGLGILAAVPFFVRNVILSGWLIYPFTAIDLFPFDFKIPRGMADYDAREIQVWGRGYSDVARYDEPLRIWLPGWIKGLSGTDKVFLALALSGVLILTVLVIYAFLRKKGELADYLFAEGVLTVCFLFWLLSAPLIRYGCVFLWMSPVLIWGHLYLLVSPHLDRFRIYYILLAVTALYKLAAFGVETGRGLTSDYLLKQKDYENFETIEYELHGYTFYYPSQGDRTGYLDFPAAPLRAEEGVFRGETIKEGFKDAAHQ